MRLTLVAALLLAFAPSFGVAATAIPNGLVIPHDAVVRYERTGRDGDAHFSGRFILTGTFYYGCGACEANWRGRLNDEDIVVQVYPDSRNLSRLPRWRDGDAATIDISNPIAFARAAIPPKLRRAVHSGQQREVTGHISILVDRFWTDIECDAPFYSARFVGLASRPSLKPLRLPGSGCAG